jgi:hypothetical protein
MELHTAILLVNYQVEWSTTAATEAEMEAAVDEFALSEWRGEPEDFPLVEDEAGVLEDRAYVLEQRGVLITFEHTVGSTV